MTLTSPSNPFVAARDVARYTVRPRENRAFHTALDARDLFTSSEPATVTWSCEGSSGALAVQMPLGPGDFAETCSFELAPELRPVSFERSLRAGERVLRHELVDFTAGVPRLPPGTFPETLLPFLLRSHPLDGERRSVYAWICDRFVAKVYYEVHKRRVDLRVPAGAFTTTEVVMYPDLNDWVKLGSMLTKLVKPFLPKYHMWFADRGQGPHELVRFEGPYGPPGAPEIVLERVG